MGHAFEPVEFSLKSMGYHKVVAGEQKTWHNTLMGKTLQTDWLVIEQAVSAGLDIVDAEKKFGVKADTIRKRSTRYKWVMPKHVALAVRAKNEIAVQKAAENWLEKGEQHRETAFQVASDSVKKFKAKAPKNFRELEAADKIARRAAGLDTGDGVTVQTLINLNERMNNHEDETVLEAEPIEADAVVEVVAEVVETEEDESPSDSVETTAISEQAAAPTSS